MANQIEVVYSDGRKDTVQTTMFDNMQAEKYSSANGWGTMNDSPIRFTLYIIYFSLRRQHLIDDGLDFESWSLTVADFDSKETEDPLLSGLTDPSVSSV